MIEGIDLVTAKIEIEPDDFDELVDVIVDGFALTTFSTNFQQSIFVPPGLGHTEFEGRKEFAGTSFMLDQAAKAYRDFYRMEGGRFTLDWRGAFCADTKRYFLEWNKSAALRLHVSQLRKSLSQTSYRDSIVRMLSMPIRNS